VQHIVVVFHEGRWAPWTGEDVEFSAGGGQHLLKKWNSIFPVVLDAEGFQLFVALAYIGVAAAGEIAAVNVCARKLIADTVLVVEIGGEQLALSVFRQQCERLG
jgi:hypothetical protein